ncbi:hypothetical protein HDU76_000409 [Blyttiomyces sp. JEL0837]|nr:hypothetical protein HDU76_000409 [Blyttiomyces sp. JEL0837]
MDRPRRPPPAAENTGPGTSTHRHRHRHSHQQQQQQLQQQRHIDSSIAHTTASYNDYLDYDDGAGMEKRVVKRYKTNIGGALSARFSDVFKEGRNGQYYYGKARTAALEAMDSPCLDDVQALVSLYEYTILTNAPSEGWIFLGMMTAMSTLLDLNVDPDDIEKATGVSMSWLEKKRVEDAGTLVLPSILELGFELIIYHVFTSSSFMIINKVLSPPSSTSFLFQSKSNVKPFCNDDIWESLADPSQLQHLYSNQPSKSESVTFVLTQYTFIFRKVMGLNKPVNEDDATGHDTAQTVIDNFVDDGVIEALEDELNDAYAAVPGPGRFPLEVKNFTRGAARFLIESQSLVAREFKEWVLGTVNNPTGADLLPWSDLVVGREPWIYDCVNSVRNDGRGFSGKPNAPSPSTIMSPIDWVFEMWNRTNVGPPWKTVNVNYFYHYCIIMLHHRRLFEIVKVVSEIGGDGFDEEDEEEDVGLRVNTPTSPATTTTTTSPSTLLNEVTGTTVIGETTMRQLNKSFQHCRTSAEHVCVILNSIIEGGSLIGVKSMFVGLLLQTLYQTGLVFAVAAPSTIVSLVMRSTAAREPPRPLEWTHLQRRMITKLDWGDDEEVWQGPDDVMMALAVVVAA